MQSLFSVLPEGVFIFLYADDIVLLVTGKTIGRIRIKLQAAVNAVRQWALSVGFRISISKSFISHCCTSHHRAYDRPIRIDDTVIPFRKEPRILGITLDRMLTFMPHFRKLKKDCESRKRLTRTICTRHPKCNRQLALNISNSLINSRLYYGIEITCRNIPGMINILAPLFHGSIRAASNLLPSTPAESACMEAGVLPFRWTIALVALRRALGFLERTSGEEDCSILRTAKAIHEEFSTFPLPPLARLHWVWHRPWNIRPPNIDTTLARSVGAGAAPEIARAAYYQLIDRCFSNHVKLFTDGSKTDRNVGVGVSGIGAGLAFHLPPTCSVFSAEAAAIALALSRKPEGIATVICSDSLSVISALESGESRHPFVQAIEMYDDPLTTICWIPGHSGISGNEDADNLAALGRTARRALTKEVPKLDIIRAFKQSVLLDFQRQWRNSHGYLHKVKDTVQKWVDRDNRNEQRILSRLRVGHTRISHAHNLSRTEPTICNTCNTRLTIEHLLVNCIELADLRRAHNLPTCIKDVLANDPTREEAILLFLKDAKIYNTV
ncbi:uncharacterized protein LOC131681121 [Topomyia yanbarensis]|uniref:uncharacterized protein LOC131681121 n=1 Tax=Topomyia yanbarensis TaxID=2498891 RepID=UPI00273CE332|nr:uncharacterized protein LOC131681121 [Topomyia yanbarensis]